MSIAPPSDIVLDVAQAADPLKLEAATARLAQIAAGAAAGTNAFSNQLAAIRQHTALTRSAATPTVPDDRPTRIDTRPTSPYQKFEALVLGNFVETMLPKDSDLFGDAASSGAYRSMLAEQMANQLAKTGKIGIAKAIEHAHGNAHPISAGPATDAA